MQDSILQDWCPDPHNPCYSARVPKMTGRTPGDFHSLPSSNLQPVVDALSEAALCHEPDGTIGAVNAAAERLLACSRYDLIGHTWTGCGWAVFDHQERAVPEQDLPSHAAPPDQRDHHETLLGIRTEPHAPIKWVAARAVRLPTQTDHARNCVLVLLEAMVIVPEAHPAAAGLDRVSQVPPAERQFRKLAKTEARHRALFEHSKSVMLLIHPVTGRILDANRAACEFYGYSPPELVRMHIQQLNTLTEAEVRREMARANAKNTSRFRFRHRLASGQIREVEVFSSPIPIDGDEVLHSIVFDVTRRESAQQQIRDRNWELRLANTITAASIHGVSSAEILQSVCVELSEHMTASEVLALTIDPVTEQVKVAAGVTPAGISSCVGTSLDPSDSQGLAEQVALDSPWYVEDWRTDQTLRCLAPAITTTATAMLVLPRFDDQMTRGAFILASNKIQELASSNHIRLGKRLVAQVSRALTIARIERTRRRLLAAIEQSTDMIIITELDGSVIYGNPAFEAATGRSLADEPGQHFPDVVRVPDLREVWATVAMGHRWSGSFRVSRNDGSRLHADAVVSPVRNPSGETVSIIAVIRDATREKHLQQQVHQAQKMESIGRLAGGLAHDFNNTLAAVMGYAGLVRARLDPDHPAYSDVIEIQETILRASNISRQLLTFARRQVTEPRPVDLNGLILNLDRMLCRLIGEDIELVTAPASSLHRTVAEPGQIEQVIVNIVVNARDALEDGGKIVIQTENVELGTEALAGRSGAEPGEYVHLSIRDDGGGMTEEVRQHLFEPFFTTKSPDKGTGLGLATCFGIVGQCGGFIDVESEVGKGTTVHVYLPASASNSSAPPSERAPMNAPHGDETVLIAEDDPIVRRMAARLLTRHGYKVLEAANGEEALREADRFPDTIHALLTDVIMPRLGARELIEEIRKRRPEIKVILMSGYADDSQLRQSAGEHQIPFLSKPFTEMMLLHKIRTLLDP